MKNQLPKPCDERQFLHDLATPISTALFIVDGILDRMKTRSAAEDVRDELSKVYLALEKISKMVHGRREDLTVRGGSGARS